MLQRIHSTLSKQQLHISDTLTIYNLIPFIKESFPELEAPILELEQDKALKAENGFEQFVFSYIFNPFFKNIMQNPQDTHMCERLFIVLEIMAYSSDVRVRHILKVEILGSLSTQELAVAQQYMGPITKKRSKGIWDREEFEERLKEEKIWLEKNMFWPEKSTVDYWGHGKHTADELEWKLNFTCDPDTRSFIEEIGNVSLKEIGNASHEGINIIIADNATRLSLNPVQVRNNLETYFLRQNLGPTALMEIMHYAGLHYILHKNGSITARDYADSYREKECYISLAYLFEEILENITITKALSEAYRALKKQKTSLIRRNRPKLSQQQKNEFNKRITDPLHSQQVGLCIYSLILIWLPELPENLEDWTYAFGDDYIKEQYEQELLNQIVVPVLITFLNLDPGNCMVARHLFYVLEKMTEDQDLKSKLALTVFESLSNEQLEIGKKYMLPKTRELLKDLEDYFEELFAKK